MISKKVSLFQAVIKKGFSQNKPKPLTLICGAYWNRTSDLLPVKQAL